MSAASLPDLKWILIRDAGAFQQIGISLDKQRRWKPPGEMSMRYKRSGSVGQIAGHLQDVHVDHDMI